MSIPPTARTRVPGLRGTDLTVLLGWLLLLLAVLAGPLLLPTSEQGEAFTRWTVRLALLCYAPAAALLLLMHPHEFLAQEGRGRLARWFWTLGLVSYLIHLGMAFHFYHGWSHAHAVARVQRSTGFGQGIWMSHFFTLLWVVDVASWWLSPGSYARRSPWFDRFLHSYMLFITFNATVIFEPGPIRIAGLLLFSLLSGVALYRLRRDRFVPVLREELSP